MAKYIIELEDEYTKDWINETPMRKELCIPISVPNRQRTYHVLTGFKLETYTEPDRKAIEDEVWEFTRAINYMGYDDFVSCFGGKTEELVYELSYSEVKAKYDAWKQEKEELHVGDEVTAKTDTDKDMPKGIVTYNNPEQSQFLVIKSDGTFSWWHKGGLRKTGRHFDEVERLLERMREE